MRGRVLTLPYPPSANRYWRVWQNRVLLSREARAYKAKARLLALAAGIRPLSGPVSLTLRVYRPRRVGDLSNRIKVLEDSLNGAAYADDAQVRRILAELYDDKADPRVEVEIHELTEGHTCSE